MRPVFHPIEPNATVLPPGVILRRAGVRPRLPRRLGRVLLALVVIGLVAGVDLMRAAAARHAETFSAATLVLQRLRLDVVREHAARASEVRALALGGVDPASQWRALAARYHCIDFRSPSDSVQLRLGECPPAAGAEPVLVMPRRQGGVVRAVLRRDALLSPMTADARAGVQGYSVLFDRQSGRVLEQRNAPVRNESDDPVPVLTAAARPPGDGVRHVRYGRGAQRVSAAILDLQDPAWTLLVAGRVSDRGTLWQRAWLPELLFVSFPAALLALAMLYIFRRRLAAAAAYARAEGRRARAAETVLSWLSAEPARDPALAARQLSHELRNPLSSLRLELESLTGSRDPRVRRVAGAGLQEMERLDAVLRNALAVARDAEPAGQRAPLRAALHRAAEALAAELWAAKCRLELPPPGPDVWVPASPDDLQRVFINLLRNAQQAMPDGGRIVVTMNVDRETVAVRVIDEGRGVPAELRTRVFEPLFTTRPGGTGLGLPAVRSVTERAGGRVQFVAPHTGGAVVELVLPVLPHGEEDS